MHLYNKLPMYNSTPTTDSLPLREGRGGSTFLPCSLGKAQFAMMLYGIDDPVLAAHRFYREYKESQSLQKALAQVGYRPRSKKLLHREMLIILEVLGMEEIS